jgi:ribosomal silencing factor RsfS
MFCSKFKTSGEYDDEEEEEEEEDWWLLDQGDFVAPGKNSE